MQVVFSELEDGHAAKAQVLFAGGHCLDGDIRLLELAANSRLAFQTEPDSVLNRFGPPSFPALSPTCCPSAIRSTALASRCITGATSSRLRVGPARVSKHSKLIRVYSTST